MKLLAPVFCVTLFLSAFLLFGVQPLFSKMVLPYLGGSPMVWNTAMVFFQGMLLAGYGYAYFNSKIKKVWLQISIHVSLFVIFISFLPFAISADDIPNQIVNPTMWQISLMLGTIGAPFFILSGCAPLLQRWFSYSNHKSADNPYFLYAASNVGSMLALLSYPVIVDPLFGLDQQSYMWSALYVLLISMVLLSGFLAWRGSKINNEISVENVDEKKQDEVIVTFKTRLFWLVLSFIPSSLMLGVTTYITTDVASVPLLWIMPLSLYVGTFIIAFADRKLISDDKMKKFHAISLALIVTSGSFAVLHLFLFEIILHLGVFFLIALSCHSRLVEAKPDVSRLTEFYFFMSLGGVLGGVFNALIAPILFTYTWEYSLILILSAFFVAPKELINEIKNKDFFKNAAYISALIALVIVITLSTTYGLGILGTSTIISFFVLVMLIFINDLRLVFATVLTVMLLINPLHYFYNSLEGKDEIHITRNFFGTIKVTEGEKARYLFHGTTLHGLQFKDENLKYEPVAYYNEETALGQAFTHFTDEDPKMNVAVLGLGTGGLACYTTEGRKFDFYEIDKDMLALSEELNIFSYIKNCGNPYEVILGDARIKIEEQPDYSYDLIAIDVFSSDNIPVHLITKEAFEIYLSKLKKDGVILFHITNRHLDLRPVLTAIAESTGVHVTFKSTAAAEDEDDLTKLSTTAALISRDKKLITFFNENKEWKALDEELEEHYLWTDKHANLLGAFRLVRAAQGKKIQ